MILAYRRVEGKVDKRKKIVLSQQRGADGEPKLVFIQQKVAHSLDTVGQGD